MSDPATTQTRNRFYHVGRDGYGIGDYIPPGRFGRLIRHFSPGRFPGDARTFKTTMWEMALETARLSLAPNAVSRLDCLFACENIEMAYAFREFKPNRKIYEVEIWPGAAIYRGDFGLISYKEGLNGPYVDFMPSIAVQYWTQEPGEHVEVLVSGMTKVVDVIESV